MDSELVKMILKNMNPHLASQIRSRVNIVDELVKFGQQLEKDYEQQLQYEKRVSSKQPLSMPQRPIANHSAEKPLVQCTHLAAVLTLSLLSPSHLSPPANTFPLIASGQPFQLLKVLVHLAIALCLPPFPTSHQQLVRNHHLLKLFPNS